MGKKIAVFFRLTPYNKNSINALTSSVEKSEISKEIGIYYFEKVSNLKEKIKKNSKNQTPIIAYSFNSIEFPLIKKELKLLKKTLKPNPLYICGGPHPSGNPEECLQAGFNAVFTGEAEKEFLNSLSLILKGKGIKKLIKGEPVNVNNYPCVSKSFPFFVPIEISRGCLQGCKYCQTSYLFGPPRHRRIENILQGVRTAVEKNYSKIRFLTPNGLGYPQLEELLIKTQQVLGVKKIYLGNFPSEIWPGDVDLKKIKLLRKYAANQWITIGAQTGSDSMLKKMHRFHSVENVKKATEISIKAGFKVNIDFIFGLPEEAEKDFQKTKKLIEYLLNLGKTKIHGHYFLPLPGTPWKNEKPVKIPSHFFNFLEKLEKKKLLYGDWKKQMEFTQK